VTMMDMLLVPSADIGSPPILAASRQDISSFA
jgi:hypothetical protein